jgi:hypothetical protein
MRKIIGLLILTLTIFAGTATAQWRDDDRRDRRDRYERVVYTLYGNGVTDDTAALNAFGRGERVRYRGSILRDRLTNGRFLISGRVSFTDRDLVVTNNVFIVRGSRHQARDIVYFGYGVRNVNNRLEIVEGYDRRRRRNGIIFRFPF